MSNKLTLSNHESLDAFLRYATQPPTWPGASSNRPSKDGWSGAASVEEAAKLARDGWTAGRDKLASVVSRLTAQTTLASRPTETFDVAGAYPVAALAAAGDPACMVDLQPVEDRRRPIIRLAVQIGASAAYSPEQFTNYGAALSVLIDAMEAAAFRCELTVFWSTSANGEDYVCKVMAKRAEDAPEIGRIAYMLTHVSMLRRLCFRAIEQHPDLYSVFYNRGYGIPTIAKEAFEADETVLPGVNVFTPGSAELKTPEAALKALEPIIRQVVETRGGKLPALWMGGH